MEGVSFGLADGVGGWVDSGVDPSLFSQALMYHAHRYSRNAWAGEPEIDPTMDYEEREQIEGWEMTPYECLDLAYGGVLREKFVQAGERLFTWDPSLRFGSVFMIFPACTPFVPLFFLPRVLHELIITFPSIKVQVRHLSSASIQRLASSGPQSQFALFMNCQNPDCQSIHTV